MNDGDMAAGAAPAVQRDPADAGRRRWGIAPRPFPGWLYGILFVLFDVAAVAILEVGVSLGASSRVTLSSPEVGWDFVGKMFTDLNFVFVLNVLLVGVLYLALLMLFNRFWIAAPVLIAAAVIVAVIEHFKISIRYEAVLPSDLNFLKADAGNLMGFMPAGAHWTILAAIAVFAVFAALFVFLNHIDARRGRMFRGSDRQTRSINAVARLLLILVPGLFFGLYAMQVSTVGSWAKNLATVMGDKPSMWDSVYDAQRNGPLVAFMRQVNPKVMDKPSDYSEETMKQVVARYQKAAKKINASRGNKLTDSTVIYVLSESFSDTSRVPGLKVNKDSMPKIRAIKQNTTSGLMLSSGYGGGTANLEYMGLTGLSMANFDSSLTSPYQQLVPGEHWTPTINQMWGAAKNSIGLHPYESSMYSRATNYKKFGFSHFYTLTGPDVISHQDRIDDSPYVSDASTYLSTLEEVRKTDSNQFLQVITMQNHMPYHEWYKDNDFTAESTTGTPLGKDEQESIQTYQKGQAITDEATADFLDELDKLDKPVTVVFYGDHLPGIYSSASEDDDNSLALHLTDYFIWSNKASGAQGTKINNAAYSSPNFFVAQAAQHMDAKVSPYLAFLTMMHQKIAAMEPPVVNKIQGWDRIPEGQSIYLDHAGNPMAESDFDEETRQLLADYKLIQYDITDGRNYLKDTGFMDLP
ncbi:LTA synthase family protein [Bifidobacterium santillanense]|nr:LTA synthase family protein [Bifidobacterium santillanense]